MKKLFLVLLVFSFTSSILALESNSKYATNQPTNNTVSGEIIENIDVVIEKKNIVEANIVYTIPEDCNLDEIVIVSKLFDKLASSDGYVPGDGILVNISVINNSLFDYEYKDYSFILSTEDLRKYELEDTPAIGFDNMIIKKDFNINRTINSAIRSLYGKKITKEMLSDELLDIALKEKNYKGIEELDKYYLDYYNSLNSTNIDKLENFDASTISVIFNGNDIGVKETNANLIELGYNYWYNTLFSFHFNNEYDYKKSDLYSIGAYMRDKELGNPYFKEYLGLIKTKETNSLTDMKIRINGPYTTNAYQNYNFSAYLEFRLNKVEELETKSVIKYEDVIIPPKTGI